jgi:predicted lipoprotein
MNKIGKHMQKSFLIVAIIFLFSCQTKDKNNKDMSFNRADLLTQTAEQMIKPALDNAKSAALELQDAVIFFANSPNGASLLAAQEKWKLLAIAWQSVNMYNFGPAGEMGINKTLNEEAATFPVTIAKIENYVLTKDASFNNFDRDARGLFAIEFLLFGLNQKPEEVMASFNENSFRASYLLASTNKLTQQINQVQQAWNTNYSKEFISNAGTDISSSISLYYNEFLKSYEGFKNFKFGIPLGLRPGQANPLPQNVEAYYSGISLQLAKAHWQQLKNIWEGRGNNGVDGIGFKEYLESVSGGQELIVATQQQMFAIDQAFAAIKDQPLSKSISEDFEKVNAVHTELQKHTRFFKSDLSSLIGISITYSSGDGD